MRVELWAPDARDVTCILADSEVPLSRRVDPNRPGWWDGPDLPHGADYSFLVDGGGPYPDPRSAWQPYGVHGASKIFDASHFSWTDANWRGRDARGAVTYELHVGTFTAEGTFDAAAEQMPDLAAIGVEMVELMPVAPMPGRRGWGYDGVSLFAVYEEYGGPRGLQRLVDAAHAAGVAVTLDVVYNHLGPAGNYLAMFGPYFTDAHTTPWGWAVNLDQPGNHEVRRYIADNALRWFSDFHIDALRLDAVHALKDGSEEHMLAQLSGETADLAADLGRPLSLVAESDLNDANMVTGVDRGGVGMTAQWDDDYHHALHTYLTGERHGYYADFGSIEVLDTVARNVFLHDGTFSTFRGEVWGAPVPADMNRHRFVVCASNHDQVGNRALGDRPSARLSAGGQAASLAFVLLGPFTPMLFMGEEYGETSPFMFFTDHEADLGRAVSEGRMSEFGGHGWEVLYGGHVEVPDPQAEATFIGSKLSRASGGIHDDIRAWFATLVDVRSRTLAPEAWLRNPVSFAELAPRVARMHGPVTVVANLSPGPITVSLGTLVGSFGIATAHAGDIVVAPDAVALLAP